MTSNDMKFLIGLMTICLIVGSPSIAEDVEPASDESRTSRNAEIVQLSVSAQPVEENLPATTFTLELSKPVNLPVVILYATVSKSAKAGSDFVAQSGTVIIPAGEVTAELPVALIDDDLVEDDERFDLYVTTSPKVAELTATTIEMVIMDDDHGAVAAEPAGSEPGSETSDEVASTSTSPEAEASSAPDTAVEDDGLTRGNRIVIHFNDETLFEDVQSVRTLLQEAGYPTPEVRPVGFDISSTNIRYFFAVDQDNAGDVDRLVHGWSGGVSDGPRDFTDYTPSPIPGTIEVWIGGDGDGT